MEEESLPTKSAEEEIEEGKQKDDVLTSFQAIGIAEVILGCIIVLLDIVIVALASDWRSPGTEFSLISDGIWCSLFAIAAGITSLFASQKVTYYTVGWSTIASGLGSFFMLLMLGLQTAECIMTRRLEHIILHILIIMFGLAELVLCLHSTIVFAKLFRSCPYYVPGGIITLCMCCCTGNTGESVSFARVMYSNLNPKRHDA